MVSIRDVARKAGVSHQTVSNAINSPDIVSEATKRKIQQVIDELGYKPNASARRLRSGRSDVIAVGIATAVDRAPSPVFDEFLHLLAAEASRDGRQIMLYPRTDEHGEIRYINDLMEQSDVDAIILNELELDDGRPQWLIEHRQPFALFGRPWNMPADSAALVPWADVDGYAAIREMTMRLMAAGRSHIGYIGWSSGTGTARDRLNGWRDALIESGAAADGTYHGEPLDGWAVGTVESMGAGEEAVARLIERHPTVDAVVCPSDTLAVGAICGISHIGKMAVMEGGSDASVLSRPVLVTGFDDSALAQAFSFPSIRQPLKTVTEELMRMIRDILDGETVDGDGRWHRLLPAEVVWRSSPYDD